MKQPRSRPKPRQHVTHETGIPDEPQSISPSCFEAMLFHAGATRKSGQGGDHAFCWADRPQAFVMLRSGNMLLRMKPPKRGEHPFKCRITRGQDCIPLTAALLSAIPMPVQATCLGPTEWIVLAANAFDQAMSQQAEFRQAIFARHLRRLPLLLQRASGPEAGSLDQRLADWLLSYGATNLVQATHAQIAADLITAREVVSRRLKYFAERGWIIQARGQITVTAAAALSRVARGRAQWSAQAR